MRVTQKGQVTIPLEIRDALGISPGSDVRFELHGRGARLVRSDEDVDAMLDQMTGTSDTGLSSDEILALSRG